MNDPAATKPRIAILGASGLIGHAIASQLTREGWPIVGIARRFSRAQAAVLDRALICPIVDLDADALAALLREEAIDIVVNCVGVLQDGPTGTTGDVHEAFARRLTAAIAAKGAPVLLVHLSVPGEAGDDPTSFSRSKRRAETILAKAGSPYVILRPGFVVAPAAYGGSALIRALAAGPFDLPPTIAETPFSSVAVEDIAATVAVLARRWAGGEREWGAVWDLVHPSEQTTGSVIAAFRRSYGVEAARRLTLPAALMTIGAKAGDATGRLGWKPPIRTTALAELARGVQGEPQGWIAATGIAPLSLGDLLASRPASIQEIWFARLYLLKALVLGTLALFWIVSGLVSLTIAFQPARDILVAGGFAPSLATVATVGFGALDVAIGVAIGIRRSVRAGLWAGIAVASLYLAAATLLVPALWLDPLGALVKTVPAIVLMLVGLAIAEER